MKFCCTKILLSLLTLACEVQYGECKRDRVDGRDGLDVEIEVPTAVRVGDTVVLKCLYDLGGDSLYTMKWYKGNHEFYRYTPKESPPVKTFTVPGLSIDLSQSNATQLTLKRVDLNLAARYSCEVTTDFPNVIADIKTAYLRVMVYPEKKPEIVISHKRRYAVGDILDANCSSYRSKPAANLTWLINDKRVSSRYQHAPQEHRYRDVDNTESSRITFRYEIQQSHFFNGQLKLSCLAEIQDHYHQASEVIIYEEDRPKISSVVDNSSSTGSGSNSRFKNSGSSSSSGSKPPNLAQLLLMYYIVALFSTFPSIVLSCVRELRSSPRKFPSASGGMSLRMLMR